MDEIKGNELRGHLETMVLSVLERGEAHGYEILQRLEDAGCGALKLKEGTLYPALYRLEGLGFLAARWEANEESRRGPRRRNYRLTRKGTAELARRRASWRSFVTIIGNIVEA
ncbi:MAG: helix-turn-helix transcriptional regulator [Candidatus Hydrogenedentes bacterium]|nr:helix-turn-helix transcriptional regulator [Candidatus Hydrogenedentota bacterium]